MPEEQSVHAARRESEREISPGHRAQLPVQQPCAHMHLHCMHARAHIRSRILLPPSLSPSFSRRTVYALDISLSLSLSSLASPPGFSVRSLSRDSLSRCGGGGGAGRPIDRSARTANSPALVKTRGGAPLAAQSASDRRQCRVVVR